jgi:hypothetical protein
MSYLKEYWIWILLPMIAILGWVVWLVYFSIPPDNAGAPHQYSLFD